MSDRHVQTIYTDGKHTVIAREFEGDWYVCINDVWQEQAYSARKYAEQVAWQAIILLKSGVDI